MRRSEDQERQQTRWAINGIDLSQSVVRTEQTLGAVWLRVPLGVELSEDKTKIEKKGDKEASTERQYSTACLKAFLTLSVPTPEKILAFVREWGPLVLVEDGEISGVMVQTSGRAISDADLNAKEEKAVQELVLPPQEKTGPFSPPVPLSHWSEVAAEMAAVIDLVSFLQETGDRNEQDAVAAWGILTKKTTAFPSISREKLFEEAVRERDEGIKVLLNILTTSWLEDVGAAPIVDWEGPAPSIRLWLPNKRWASLYAALVLNLVTVISTPERLFRCGWCGRRSFKTAKEKMTRRGLIPRCTDAECLTKSNNNKSIKSNRKARAKVKLERLGASSAGE